MTALPKIALIGRPNVGKSTLFNRLIRSNRAITHDRPGVTRDRMEGVVRRQGGRSFRLIDTGGVHLEAGERLAPGPEASQGFEEETFAQASRAIEEAAAVCLVVDGKEGLLPFDESLAEFVRKSGKPMLVVVNKVDGEEKADMLTADFHALGFEVLPVSAEHGFNLIALYEALADLLPPQENGEGEEKEEEPPLRLAMLGRPNAGKSSIVNALAGETRMIVSDIAGTTRDSVDVSVEKDGRVYTFVDTAGVRRRTKITDAVERFSVNSSIKSTTKADVTLLVLDAEEGLSSQDKRLIALLDERRTPFMVLVNKMDRVPRAQAAAIKKSFQEALQFCRHVPLIPVSAKTGQGLSQILPAAERIKEECGVRVPTSVLNRSMEEALARHQPPVVNRVRAKFYYLTQAETNPPTFVMFVNDPDRVKESYVRYLEKSLRAAFDIRHAPMRLNFRSSHKKEEEK